MMQQNPATANTDEALDAPHTTCGSACGNVDNTGHLVTITYRGFFDDGSTFLDQTQQPLDFPCMEGWMPPELFAAVRVMHTGETTTVRIGADAAYEEYDEARVLRVERASLPADISLSTGSIVHLEARDGQTYPARVIEQADGFVLFDTNHAAVGKALNFEIHLISVSNLRRPSA